MSSHQNKSRRDFIKKAATAAIVTSSDIFQKTVWSQERRGAVAIFSNPEDAATKEMPVQWAVATLRETLMNRGARVQILDRLDSTTRFDEYVLVSSRSSVLCRQVLDRAGAMLPDVPEASGIVRGKVDAKSVLLACGSDVRGLVYGLLELADRVNLSSDPIGALKNVETAIERPANAIRSVARFFVSDVEDKSWFNDREFWKKYLSMLAAQRFNRFSLTLGIGYDFTSGIRDCYFHFAYPFLLSVPGYNVRANPLPDAERDRNLEMLKFIGEETARRGLHFQLGLWTHAYKWTNSPNANYTIEGLTPETHAAYCRDALHLVLKACPAINGVTFRVHGESGVPEASYEFWRTIFDGIVKCGRKVEIDMHAKGMDDQMIGVALGTGMPVNISPKYWAEHMGLPYMQASIRPLEMPPAEARDTGFFSKSSGSRRFLRYGYGDLMMEGRRFGVLHRIWPGTQRLLLWGDPAIAAGYGRASSFCGSAGLELCEPLSFKGRKGSGLPGPRDAYADASLRSEGGGWEKYLYTYRHWGRLTYNPEANPEIWRRYLRQQFGAAADATEAALANASRILPLVTTAHCPSAANNNYWPEIYTNMPIADSKRPHPYGDTMNPKRFGAVSSLDPELFSRMDDFAGELLKGEPSGKFTPAETAQWLETFSESSSAHLAEAKSKNPNPNTPDFRRLELDVRIQNGLGIFFAWKFRAGVLYGLFERTRHRPALQEALKAYRTARNAWAQLAELAKDIYVRDITFGYDKHLRGHWLDRLPAIDQDIADLEKKLESAGGGSASRPEIETRVVDAAVRSVLAPTKRPVTRVNHTPPKSFRRGQPVHIEATLANENGSEREISVRLHFRRVNQSEIWRVVPMQALERKYSATIPAEYTDSLFPLEYYFELREVSGSVGLHPGFAADLSNQPYFVVRQT